MYEIKKHEHDAIVTRLIWDKRWSDLYEYLNGNITKNFRNKNDKNIYFGSATKNHHFEHGVQYLDTVKKDTVDGCLTIENVSIMIVEGQKFYLFYPEKDPDILITEMFTNDNLKEIYKFDEFVEKGSFNYTFYIPHKFSYTIQNLLNKDDDSIQARLITFNSDPEIDTLLYKTFVLYKQNDYMFHNIKIKLLKELYSKKDLYTFLTNNLLKNQKEYIDLAEANNISIEDQDNYHKYTQEELDTHIKYYEDIIFKTSQLSSFWSLKIRRLKHVLNIKNYWDKSVDNEDGMEVLIKATDKNKNTHISFLLNNNEVLVVETNNITNTNPIKNNPSWILYTCIDEYIDDFKDSYFNNNDKITYSKLEIN